MPSSSSTALSPRRLPTTTCRIRRWSGSRATWSHWSPRNQSASSSGSQRFSFLPTKDHFSSSWTLVVRGGKSHELVVDLARVAPGPQAVADHRVLVDADEAAGLADAAAVRQV